MTNRSGNFVVRLRFIEGVKRTAKRVTVLEKDIPKSSSGEAWKLVKEIVSLASSKPGVALISLEVYEDGERIWTEL